MKGFIFTVDAVFSLIIAGIAASILLYISAQPQPIMQASMTQAFSTMQGLLDMKAGEAVGYVPQQYADPFLTLGGTSVAQFNGHGSYISASYSPLLNLGNTGTLSVWVRPAAVPTGTHSILDYGGSSYSTGYLLSQYGTSLYAYWATSSPAITASNAFSPNALINIVLTDSNGALTAYVNGVQVGTGSSGGATSASQTTYVGGLGSEWNFTGSTSNVQVYNISLSQSQVSQLYKEGAGGPPAQRVGLVSWWPLNGNATDVSGHGNNGTAVSVPYTHTDSISFPGASVQANSSSLDMLTKLYANGQSAYADMVVSALSQNDTGIFINGTYAPSLNVSHFSNSLGSYVDFGTSPILSPSSAQTITAWFKILPEVQGVLVGLTGYHNTMSSWGPGQGSCGQALLMQAYWQTSSVPNGYSLDACGGSASDWNFEAMTYNSSTGYLDLYADGALIGNVYLGGTIAVSGTYPVTVGAREGGTNLNFNGLIANVQIYNASLNDSQIASLYQEGMGGQPVSPNNLVAWWPLMGDTNDYSGHYLTGTKHSVSFVNGNYLPKSFSSAYTVSTATVPLLLGSGNSPQITNVTVGVWK